MRTQLDDLKKELEKIERAISLCVIQGTRGTEFYRSLKDKKYELMDTINNIR